MKSSLQPQEKKSKTQTADFLLSGTVELPGWMRNIYEPRPVSFPKSDQHQLLLVTYGQARVDLRYNNRQWQLGRGGCIWIGCLVSGHKFIPGSMVDLATLSQWPVWPWDARRVRVSSGPRTYGCFLGGHKEWAVGHSLRRDSRIIRGLGGLEIFSLHSRCVRLPRLCLLAI